MFLPFLWPSVNAFTLKRIMQIPVVIFSMFILETCINEKTNDFYKRNTFNDVKNLETIIEIFTRRSTIYKFKPGFETGTGTRTSGAVVVA